MTDKKRARGTPSERPAKSQLKTMTEAGNLSGQYYIFVGYKEKPENVSRTVITRSKSQIVARKDSSYDITPGERPTDQLTDLLDSYEDLSGYGIVGNEAAAELSILPDIKLEILLQNETGKSISLIKDRPHHRLYISRSLDIKKVNSGIAKYWHAYRNSYAVRNAIFSGLVTAFDEAIARLIRTSLRTVPGLLNSFDLNIPYSDVVSAKDFESLRAEIIESTVSSLMWRGRLEQIKWIEKNITKNDFKSIIPAYEKFVEITERRNVYIHNNGIVNQSYIDRIKASGTKDIQVSVGEKLRLTANYFLESSDILVEAYTIISQSVVRKLVKTENEIEKADIDTHFNHCVYYQLENGRNESAARLAKSMLSDAFAVSDVIRKMAIVNYAIALKRLSKKDEMEKILGGVDWSSTRTEFALCLAAIRDDIDEVARLAPLLKSSDMVTPSSYFEWPAFEEMRDKPQFWSMLEGVYGEEIKMAVANSDENAVAFSKTKIAADD